MIITPPKDLTYSKVMTTDQDLRSERYEWLQEARLISDYLLPGRGIYNLYARPRKRRITTPRVINDTGEDALNVLTAAMHAGLTSPNSLWFNLEWSDEKLRKVDPLKGWLEQCTIILHKEFHRSNFYNVINDFYAEYAGFGTACTYMGEDTPLDGPAFRFELLTFGEYAFSTDPFGFPNVMTRPIFMTKRQLVEKFPNTVSEEVIKEVENNQAGVDRMYLSVIEMILERPFMDKPYTRVVYEVTGTSQQPKPIDEGKTPLEQSGFYEWPYPLGRWSTRGSDIYGIGPGAKAVPYIQRLQEMERAVGMATHKEVDPPLYAPSTLKGQLNTLPGARNWYSNPNMQVTDIYNRHFNYQGVGTVVERIEAQIRRKFYNDIFLTASRDPNASPLRTGQVQEQKQEQLIRMGPVVERLQYEYFTKTVERGFNIGLRKEIFPPLSPELQAMAGDYTITMISPMATAQRRVALDGLMHFMGFIGQAAQFDQRVIDNVDVDEASRQVAEIDGVPLGIVRTQDQVDQERADREQQIKERQDAEDAAAAAESGASVNEAEATAQKTQSEAGLNLIEGQQLIAEMGAI